MASCSSIGLGPSRRKSIATKEWGVVEKLLNEGRLDTVHRPEDSSLREVVERSWKRDRAEIRHAELRVEEGLRSTQELGGVLTLDTARDGLGNSP